jgi:hypothetical protein
MLGSSKDQLSVSSSAHSFIWNNSSFLSFRVMQGRMAHLSIDLVDRNTKTSDWREWHNRSTRWSSVHFWICNWRYKIDSRDPMTHRMPCKRTQFVTYNNTPLSNHHLWLYNPSVTSVCPFHRRQNRATGAEALQDYIRSVYLTPRVNLEHWIQRSVAAFINVEQLRTVRHIHIDSHCGINMWKWV